MTSHSHSISSRDYPGTAAPRRFLRPGVLINLSSSSSDDITGPITTLLENYGYGQPDVFAGPSDKMADMLASLRAHKADLMIAYGGDGTAAAVAALARAQGVPFVALPGGTMNMLMQGLYGTDDWRDCLIRALACAAPRPMIAGEVTGVLADDPKTAQTIPFFVGAIFGRPTLMNDAREALRGGQVLDAAKTALSAVQATQAAPPLSFDGGRTQVDGLELINLTCPFMTGRSLDPNAFNIALFDKVVGAKALSLGLSALSGDIRDHQDVVTVASDHVTISTGDALYALLDGEDYVFQGPVTVRLNPHCGDVLAPFPSLSFPTSQNGATS